MVAFEEVVVVAENVGQFPAHALVLRQLQHEPSGRIDAGDPALRIDG